MYILREKEYIQLLVVLVTLQWSGRWRLYSIIPVVDYAV